MPLGKLDDIVADVPNDLRRSSGGRECMCLSAMYVGMAYTFLLIFFFFSKQQYSPTHKNEERHVLAMAPHESS